VQDRNRLIEYEVFLGQMTAPKVRITKSNSSSFTVEWGSIDADVDSWRLRLLDVENREWVEVCNNVNSTKMFYYKSKLENNLKTNIKQVFYAH